MSHLCTHTSAYNHNSMVTYMHHYCPSLSHSQAIPLVGSEHSLDHQLTLHPPHLTPTLPQSWVPCSLIDQLVTDFTGQEDVWMQPQGLLVQQVAQGAIKIPETEVSTEGHQGLRSVGRHAGRRQVATLGWTHKGNYKFSTLTRSLAEPQPGKKRRRKEAK